MDLLTRVPETPHADAYDWGRLGVVYDLPSDELLMYFDGVARPAASIALDIGDHDYVYARVDPTSGETVGL